MDIVTKEFENIGGVHSANPSKTVGYGNDKVDKVETDFVNLTYFLGWGDCQAGCINKRFWKFRIYCDCSVEYFGSYGSKLIPSNISRLTQKTIKVQPNPFKNQLSISEIFTSFEYKIYNLSGEMVKNGIHNSQSISNLENSPSGIYFLQINDGKAGSFQTDEGVVINVTEK